MADATLINGRGRYPGGPNTDLTIVSVQKGKRYRLRLVSISCDPNFTFSIDNHNLTVIEADSTSIKPYTVNTIQILAGMWLTTSTSLNILLTNEGRPTLLCCLEC